MLPPNRRLCLPLDHVSVSESCACLLCTSVRRDCPIVNGTVPARVYVVDRLRASHRVTGSPSLNPIRSSFSRFEPSTHVSLPLKVRAPRAYRRATLGALVPPTASFGLVS